MCIRDRVEKIQDDYSYVALNHIGHDSKNNIYVIGSFLFEVSFGEVTLINDFRNNTISSSVFLSKLTVDNGVITGDNHIRDLNTLDVNVYPNPTKGSLEVISSSDIQFVRIYNSLGVILEESKFTNIQLSEYPIGLYFLHIQTDFGIRIVKVLKE